KLFDDEGIPTHSSKEQEGVEHLVMRKYKDYEEFIDFQPDLLTDLHTPYLLRGLERLSKSYQCLDASRPWLCYWIVHSLALLKHPIPDEQKLRICKFLSKCQNKEGGFGGGPGQMSHLAPTYAAVNCLCELATEEAYSVINRKSLLEFLWRMKQKDGSFTMHEGGEADTRSLYCAASVVALVGLVEKVVDLFDNSPQWVVRCQTYEGGIGGAPGAEAHGGYTFCGYAALVILNHAKLVDTDKLLRWVVNRQMSLEGGFQGRTNKLVDGCYSFWQGGVLPLLHNKVLEDSHLAELNEHSWLYDQGALQFYLLLCCQSSFGGLVDKPGKSPDFYHTCYGLSGLSSAQHPPTPHPYIIGGAANQLEPIHPAFNVTCNAVIAALEHFNKLPL
uniref:Protein farnesyltransferase subunit beta n=1 Tax=Ciona savignyi TaxID=51511 RepID=H2Z533_CIOSA